MLVDIPKECAVKVFKTTLNEFKTRDKYIKDDYRFKDRFSKQVFCLPIFISQSFACNPVC